MLFSITERKLARWFLNNVHSFWMQFSVCWKAKLLVHFHSTFTVFFLYSHRWDNFRITWGTLKCVIWRKKRDRPLFFLDINTVSFFFAIWVLTTFNCRAFIYFLTTTLSAFKPKKRLRMEAFNCRAFIYTIHRLDRPYFSLIGSSAWEEQKIEISNTRWKLQQKRAREIILFGNYYNSSGMQPS